MATGPTSSIPLELAHRLRPWERVLWWGRPRRIEVAGPGDRAWLPVLAILVAAAAIIAFVPQRSWHPVVATIFRLAFAFSAVSLIATHLAIVVRQRRQTVYAVTQDRALVVGGYWAGGIRSVALEEITELRLDTRPEGSGTIWFAGGAQESAAIRFVQVPDAAAVHARLVAARQARARGSGNGGDGGNGEGR